MQRLSLLHPEEIPIFVTAAAARPAETPSANIYSMAKGVIFRRCKNHKGKRRESKPHEKENHEREKIQGIQMEI